MDKFPSYEFKLGFANVLYTESYGEIDLNPLDTEKSHFYNPIHIPVSPAEAERVYWALRAIYGELDTGLLLKMIYKAIRAGADEE